MWARPIRCVAISGRFVAEFEPEYAEIAAAPCEHGATNLDMAEYFGIDSATLHRWRNAHPEFRESIKIGKAPADNRVERSLFGQYVEGPLD